MSSISCEMKLLDYNNYNDYNNNNNTRCAGQTTNQLAHSATTHNQHVSSVLLSDIQRPMAEATEEFKVGQTKLSVQKFFMSTRKRHGNGSDPKRLV